MPFTIASVIAAWIAVESSLAPLPVAPNHRTFTGPENTRSQRPAAAAPKMVPLFAVDVLAADQPEQAILRR
jgi:hypothetical protein